MKRRRERNNKGGGRKIAILCFAFERRAVSPVRKATSSTSCSLIVNRFGGGLRRTISFTWPSFVAYKILINGSLCSARIRAVVLVAPCFPQRFPPRFNIHGSCTLLSWLLSRCASSVKVKESPRKAGRFYRGMDAGWTTRSSPSSSSSFRSPALFRFKGSIGGGEVGRVGGRVGGRVASTSTGTGTSTNTGTGIFVKSQWAQVRRKRGRGRGRAEARAGARAQARVRAGSRVEARSTRPRRGPATTWRCTTTSLRSHRTARRCRPVYNARRALTFHWH